LSSFSSLLVIAANDLPSRHDFDLGGSNLAYLVLTSLAAAHNLLNYDLHVDHHFLSPPSWLQLLTTLLVVVILILVV
jgi:hypothetical protein